MGCRSDYMEPTDREKESVLVTNLLVYLLTELKKPIPPLVAAASKQFYGNIDTVDHDVKLLCSTVKSLSDRQMKKYVHDGSNPKARKLADWWDKHQEADRKRAENEAEMKKRQKLRQSAASKLSPAERKAVGLK